MMWHEVENKLNRKLFVFSSVVGAQKMQEKKKV